MTLTYESLVSQECWNLKALYETAWLWSISWLQLLDGKMYFFDISFLVKTHHKSTESKYSHITGKLRNSLRIFMGLLRQTTGPLRFFFLRVRYVIYT